MLTLRIKSRGQVIQMPGSAPFRTPATIDVSNMRIRNLIGYLRSAGIEDYEVVATSDKGVVEVYKKTDFELPKKKKETNQTKAYQKAINNRFNRLENLIGKLFEKPTSKDDSKKEQNIDEKLDRIEKLLEEASTKEVVYTKFVDKEADEIEELEHAFIPEVDVSDMKLSSSGAKLLDQDSDELEDTANLLSGLTKKEAK